MNTIDWIRQELKPRESTSEEMFYNDMDSQSGYALPIIYEPFDITRRSHWSDRGALFDFLAATDGYAKRLLDFGPGDGWPTLIMAPYVAHVTGVDGSHRRIDVCKANAERMGITNVDFVFTEPGSALPFEAESFDGATAASSIEQTPAPAEALKEICRVLKPSGRLRMVYEDLERYRGGKEREAIVMAVDDDASKLVVYDRDITGEKATMYGIALSMPAAEATSVLSGGTGAIAFERITPALLEGMQPSIRGAQVCTLRHPSGSTFVNIIGEAGFSEVLPTGSGIQLARDMFGNLTGADRPSDLAGLDRVLRPLVAAEVHRLVPVADNPPISAVK
jgi:ubiquinone/menaquinone biosynthesis C-methylase UbiE